MSRSWFVFTAVACTLGAGLLALQWISGLRSRRRLTIPPPTPAQDGDTLLLAINGQTFTHVVGGADGWTDETHRRWAVQAEELLEALETYEDEHPKGAPCLVKAMDAAGAAVVEWQDRHEPRQSADGRTS